MSQELPSNKSTNEEIDLIVFFNLIGNAFNKFFSFINSIFKSLFSTIIRALQFIFLNLKIIVGVVLITFILGYFLDMTKDKVYYSEMIIIPNFDSKYKLINNIKYFNSLIEDENYEELALQFGINKEESKALIDFTIENGPESRNQQLTGFNNFLKPFDSITKAKITFEEYLDNRSIYNSNIFLLRARTKDHKVFTRLEDGLSKVINSKLSIMEKKERDTILTLEKQNLDSALVAIRTLKKTYLTVLEKESEKKVITSSMPNNFEMQIEKTDTKEDKLLEQELSILTQLNSIKKELVINNNILKKKSSFKEKGILEDIWYKKFKIILPLLGLFLLIISSGLFAVFKYVINYK